MAKSLRVKGWMPTKQKMSASRCWWQYVIDATRSSVYTRINGFNQIRF